MDTTDSYYILKMGAAALLLVFLIFSYVKNRHNSSSNLAGIALWVSIFSILIVLYAFRFELDFVKNRVMAVLVPSYSWTDKLGQIVVSRHLDGHFYLESKTKTNQKIKFLVDTGASGISLTKQDALKLGFDLKKLKYTQKHSTANGISYSAPVRIEQLTIGKKTFYDIEASISSGGLDISLLGMSLIESFNHFKITKDMLILEY